MIVRSLFEHCGELWAPVEYVAANKFEPIQKRAVKWITSKQSSFLNESDYYNTLKKLDHEHRFTSTASGESTHALTLLFVPRRRFQSLGKSF